MMTAAPDLPDDIDALKALIVAMAEKAGRLEDRNAAIEAENVRIRAENAELAALNKNADERIARLMSIIAMFERARYGKRSEKLRVDPLSEEQYQFVFDEIDTGLAAISAELERGGGKARPPRAPRPRKAFPAHLERVEVIIEPDDAPGCEGLEKVRIGEDVSERLDVMPAKFRVIVTRRPKYAYRGYDGVIQAAAPAYLIEGGIPTEALLAQIAVSKYADGLPLYRQEAIYARDQVELSRSLMAQWMGRVGFELEPLAEHVLMRIRQAERIFADETTLPTLAPGSGRVKQAYLWTYARDDSTFGGTSPPMVAYRFEDGRGGDRVERHLDGFTGIVQIDGYGAYNRLARKDRAVGPVTLAACWSHVRRYFFELHAAGTSRIATRTIEMMAPLWAVEKEVRGQSAEIREASRQEKSMPIVAALFNLWAAELPRLPGKSKLAEAIRYALNRREILERFLHNGRIELDNNTVERAIRPQTITRKNSLFAGSDGGGKTWATIATMLATARLNNIDPHAWLTQTLERIANSWSNSRIEELMPWAFQA